MNTIIECPNTLDTPDLLKINDASLHTIFLAGGITDCPNWQADMIELLSTGDDLILFNPRREHFDITDKSNTHRQIIWENDYLTTANMILFWFPEETLCPITLYELGKWTLVDDKKIFIGCHPNYARRDDVIFQTSLSDHSVNVVDSIEKLANQVLVYIGKADMK